MGLIDNVREWGYDYYSEYDLKNTVNPTGPVTGALKVTRGVGEFGQSVADISKIEPNAVIGTGLSIHYSGGSKLSSDIDEWLSENGIK